MALAQPLSLDECLDKAAKNYPLVRQYSLIEQSRNLNLANAASAWLPQVSLSLGAYAFTDILDEETVSQMAGLDMDHYLLNGSVTVRQNIWDGGQTAANRALTSAQADVEKSQADVSLYSVKEQVVQMYFGIMLLDEQISQNLELQKDLDVVMKTTESLMDQGIASQSDCDEVEVERIKVQQSLEALKSSRKAYIKMLGYYTGEDIPENQELAKPQAAVANPEGVRPEIRLYDAQESLAKAQRKQLNVSLMPKVGLFAAGMLHTRPVQMIGKDLALAGVSLSWNIGGLYNRKRDIQKIDNQLSKIQVQREVFSFQNGLREESSNGTIATLRSQLEHDAKVASLQESIREKSEARVKEGLESVNDYLRKVNAVNLAKRQESLHEMQLLMEMYNMKLIKGE